MIKTIIFDIGGVVTHTDFKAIYSNFAKRIGLSPEFVIDYHKEKLNELLLGDINIDQFWKDMIDAGANPEFNLRAIWLDEGVKNREINKGLLTVIEKLRKNYSVGILTNLTPSRLIIDEEMNLYSYFDYTILSCREHFKKPDPEFYKLALKSASAKPEEAIFVDDKESCTVPAEALGIKSIIYLYPDNGKLIDDLKKLKIII